MAKLNNLFHFSPLSRNVLNGFIICTLLPYQIQSSLSITLVYNLFWLVISDNNERCTTTTTNTTNETLNK